MSLASLCKSVSRPGRDECDIADAMSASHSWKIAWEQIWVRLVVNGWPASGVVRVGGGVGLEERGGTDRGRWAMIRGGRVARPIAPEPGGRRRHRAERS